MNWFFEELVPAFTNGEKDSRKIRKNRVNLTFFKLQLEVAIRIHGFHEVTDRCRKRPN